MTTLRVTAPAAARRRALAMAVAPGKHDNAAEAAQTPARRGLQPIPLAALPLLDRRTHAGASSPCQRNRLKARVTIELFRGSLGNAALTRRFTVLASGVMITGFGVVWVAERYWNLSLSTLG